MAEIRTFEIIFFGILQRLFQRRKFHSRSKQMTILQFCNRFDFGDISRNTTLVRLNSALLERLLRSSTVHCPKVTCETSTNIPRQVGIEYAKERF